MSDWESYRRKISSLMGQIQAEDISGRRIPVDTAFETLYQLTCALRSERKTIYCIGNGASASIASHFAADMAKNGALHTEVFSDLALLTAIGNDLGFENVFREPLSKRAVPSDMLAAVSSSGNSPNILNAVCWAREAGVRIVTFTAMSAENRLRRLGDLNFYFPAATYGDAESLHASALHYWINMFLEKRQG